MTAKKQVRCKDFLLHIGGRHALLFRLREKTDQRTDRTVEEADREWEEEHSGRPIPRKRGISDENGEETSKRELDDGIKILQRAVTTLLPRTGVLGLFLCNPVFRRADKARLVVEQSFENRTGVIDRHANSECEQERKVDDFLPPLLFVQSEL